MIVRRNEMKIESRNVQKGEGIISHVHLVDCEAEKNIRLLAELTLQPGDSIGYHRHDSETEYYIILSGSGTVNDNGTEMPIKAGDTMITRSGDSHSIANTGNVPLVFHAVIVTY